MRGERVGDCFLCDRQPCLATWEHWQNTHDTWCLAYALPRLDNARRINSRAMQTKSPCGDWGWAGCWSVYFADALWLPGWTEDKLGNCTLYTLLLLLMPLEA